MISLLCYNSNTLKSEINEDVSLIQIISTRTYFYWWE